MLVYDSTLITPTTGLMIWTLVTFVLVLVVLRKFAFGPLQEVIETRRKAISSDLDAAEQARSEAEAALAEYRHQLSESRKEASRIVEDARRSMDEKRRSDLAELESDKQHQLERVRAEIAAETRQSLAAIKQQVADLTVTATEKVLQAKLDESEQKRLIEEALSDVDFGVLAPEAPTEASG